MSQNKYGIRQKMPTTDLSSSGETRLYNAQNLFVRLAINTALLYFKTINANLLIGVPCW